jgi:hypothetical protein
MLKSMDSSNLFSISRCLRMAVLAIELTKFPPIFILLLCIHRKCEYDIASF